MPSWGWGGPAPQERERGRSWFRTMGEERRSSMTTETGDGLATTPRDGYVQSECYCALYLNCVVYLQWKLCLIVLLLQENKSFGASYHLHSSSDVREVVSRTVSTANCSQALENGYFHEIVRRQLKKTVRCHRGWIFISKRFESPSFLKEQWSQSKLWNIYVYSTTQARSIHNWQNGSFLRINFWHREGGVYCYFTFKYLDDFAVILEILQFLKKTHRDCLT